jgi:SAM-dependent methyltransferase
MSYRFSVPPLLHNILAHPLTRNLDLDDPATTQIRRTIIARKPFLRKIYAEWYRQISENLPGAPGRVLELGSGAGFLSEYLPDLISSEIFACPGVSLILDGQRLPFRDRSLRAIAMTNVLHHVSSVHAFFEEATRCLSPGGRVVAIEPWVSPWSRVVYSKLHHEPFDPTSPGWAFGGQGPLSAANGALPWIVLERDRKRFESEFPALRIQSIRRMMPLRYLICGGISMRSLMPAFTFPFWRGLENAMRPVMRSCAMFALIVIEKR